MTDPQKNPDPAFTPATADFGMSTSATPPENLYVPDYADNDSGLPVPPKTNALAVVSLIASLAGLLTGVGFIIGLVCGHISLSQIKKRGEQGRGAALAGTIIGWVGVGISIIVIIVMAVIVGGAVAAGTVSS